MSLTDPRPWNERELDRRFDELKAEIKRLEAVLTAAESRAQAAEGNVDRLQGSLYHLEGLVIEYKREWESCCERERARWEREKEQEEWAAVVERDLNNEHALTRHYAKRIDEQNTLIGRLRDRQERHRDGCLCDLCEELVSPRPAGEREAAGK